MPKSIRKAAKHTAANQKQPTGKAQDTYKVAKAQGPMTARLGNGRTNTQLGQG